MRIEATIMTPPLAVMCEEILEMNYAESGQFPEEDFSPAMQDFIDAKDEFVAFLLWSDDAELVGVSFFYLSQHTQIDYMSVADQITFYIIPKYRKYTINFLRFTEEWFMNRHIDIIQQGAIAGSRFQRLLELKGYTPSDVSMVKRLH